MPYINIREADITPVLNYDTVNNAVLIFGFDFHRYQYPELKVTDTDSVMSDIYHNRAYKLYTSLADFLKDSFFKNVFNTVAYPYDFSNELVYRPYRTAYDCLLRGLPVIYVPVDDFIDDSLIISHNNVDSEGHIIDTVKYIEYRWLSSNVTAEDSQYWLGLNPKGFTFTTEERDAIIAQYSEDNTKLAAEKTVYKLLKAYSQEGSFSKLLPLSDRINVPTTFITTCGYEGFDAEVNVYHNLILNGIGNRLDVLYLYDFQSNLTPEELSTNSIYTKLEFVKPELVNIVYPWGHFNLYSGASNIHMPGSYAWLMAFATSIKNNLPWMATAGVYRGIIPNITSLDYDISETYLHLWQGDNVGSGIWNSSIRINPIVDLGKNYGKVIFGNRTCFPEATNQTTFRTFLNVRLLLIQIHKQLFKVSMNHMFEPNDDIVWLSFKQAANVLLDKMVTGRGIKWYKWQKLRPEDEQGNLILGQIKAKLTIRPLETVESFDITINMTDQEIEVIEGEE